MFIALNGYNLRHSFRSAMFLGKWAYLSTINPCSYHTESVFYSGLDPELSWVEIVP